MISSLLLLACLQVRYTTAAPSAPIIQQAEALAAEDRLQAIRLLEDYLQDGEDPELQRVVRTYAGEYRRLSGDMPGARLHFEALQDGESRAPSTQAAALGLALIEASVNTSGNTRATLEMIQERSVPDTMNADRFCLLAQLLHMEGGEPSRIEELADRAREYAGEDPLLERRILFALSEIIQAIETPTGPLPEQLGLEEAALQRARAALGGGRLSEAMEHAEALLSSFPETQWRPEAEWVIRLAEAGNPYTPRRVGVLLPLSGTYAPSAKRLKDALELAASEADLELLFRDTEGDPETSLNAFESLVLDQGVSLVVGPMLKNTAPVVAEEANRAGVPLIALSRAEGITEGRDYVFRGLLTVVQQVEGLLDYVMDYQGMTQFAVMAPDNDFGHASKEVFVQAVVSRGGEVLRTVHYDPTLKDFKLPAQELGLKDYKLREGEYWQLQREAKSVGMDVSKVVLPPQVDFQALFVPDNPDTVTLIGHALAYEEFPVGGFMSRDSRSFPLLGLDSWNHPRFVQDGEAPVEKSLFPSIYNAKDSSPRVEAFVDSYQAAFSRTPQNFEAMVYEVMRIVGLTLKQEPPHREAILEALVSMQVSPGPTGAQTFSPKRELDYPIQLLTVMNKYQSGTGRAAIQKIDAKKIPQP